VGCTAVTTGESASARRLVERQQTGAPSYFHM